MKIHLHDFAGHPFQAQLSRELARRGHHVEHGYCAEYVSGKGSLNRLPNDSPTLRFAPHSVGGGLAKYSFGSRLLHEFRYSVSLMRHLNSERPDVTILCNVPLVICTLLDLFFRLSRSRWILWHQDLLSLAIAKEVRSRMPAFAATPIAHLLTLCERDYVKHANGVVAIGTSFMGQYQRWGISTSHAQVIPNWACLDEISPTARNNPWATAHQLPSDRLRLLYSGTLGRKHNPELLLTMLHELLHRGIEAHLTVISEGEGIEGIRPLAQAAFNATLLPFQTAEDLPLALGASDILVTLLEPGASEFSIPSKTLTYMAAGRAVIGLMPGTNPAAADIRAAGGFVAPPTMSGAKAAADWIKGQLCIQGSFDRIGRDARARAEQLFDIRSIADRFEEVLTVVSRGQKPTSLARECT